MDFLAAAGVDGIERIRFTSPHPSDMSESVMDAMVSEPKVQPYLHLPVQSGSKGLMSALQHLASEVEELFDISCRFRVDKDVSIRNSDLATHLYRIAQEAVTNAIKHGQSRQIFIGLSHRRGNVILSIQDDGSGFTNRLKNKEGMGIRTMNYRANMIGASLDIQKNPTGGTVVVCTLPMGIED